MKSLLCLISIFLVLAIFCSCTQKDEFSVLKGPYFGQTPPGKKAELFAPSIFPEGESLGCSGFLKNNTMFIFSSTQPNSDWRFKPLYITEQIKGRWTKLKIVPFNKYSPYNFTVGPDGQTVYFTSLVSPDKTTSMFLEQANIWGIKLEMNGWQEPMMLGHSINTERYYENYPSVTNNGTIYYMSRRDDGMGKTDVFRSKNIDGKYGVAENLGSTINTEDSDVDPFIAPDESYLIVCQERDGGFGAFDLYVYFKNQDDSWTEGRNMGKDVNSSNFEFRPYVTQDGKYLFFTSNRPDNRIYWVDAKVIEELKPDELK